MKVSSMEKFTFSFVIIFISVLCVGAIIMMANATFHWNLFPPFFEQIIYFFAGIIAVLTLAAAGVNVMINIARLAFYSEKIAGHLLSTHIPTQKGGKT